VSRFGWEVEAWLIVRCVDRSRPQPPGEVSWQNGERLPSRSHRRTNGQQYAGQRPRLTSFTEDNRQSAVRCSTTLAGADGEVDSLISRYTFPRQLPQQNSASICPAGRLH